MNNDSLIQEFRDKFLAIRRNMLVISPTIPIETIEAILLAAFDKVRSEGRKEGWKEVETAVRKAEPRTPLWLEVVFARFNRKSASPTGGGEGKV